jgi:hypothetical protein
MSNLQFSHSSAKLRPVKRVQFSVISPEQIVRCWQRKTRRLEGKHASMAHGCCFVVLGLLSAAFDAVAVDFWTVDCVVRCEMLSSGKDR